ncbi:DUF6221 family protein [Streptomyces scopuliridis]|uniref:DUF6221 family protein n=1 Tax=Streptomyces TaxID=1883 RepID=UPI0024747418|nr:DUF6221 family protein [Streptomyces sp. LBL]
MATNKYEDDCAHCRRRLPPGAGTLRKGRTGWLAYCPAEAPDPRRPGPVLEPRNPDRRRHDPLAAFLHARLDEDEEGTDGDGTSWRHHPPRSGTVIDDHDQPVLHTRRDVATHLATWNPNHVRENLTSQRLIVDLYEAASGTAKEALHDAVRALAMTYWSHPDFDPSWLLREW